MSKASIKRDSDRLRTLASRTKSLGERVADQVPSLDAAVGPSLRGDVPEIGAIDAAYRKGRRLMVKAAAALHGNSAETHAYLAEAARTEQIIYLLYSSGLLTKCYTLGSGSTQKGKKWVDPMKLPIWAELPRLASKKELDARIAKALKEDDLQTVAVLKQIRGPLLAWNFAHSAEILLNAKSPEEQLKAATDIASQGLMTASELERMIRTVRGATSESQLATRAALLRQLKGPLTVINIAMGIHDVIQGDTATKIGGAASLVTSGGQVAGGLATLLEGAGMQGATVEALAGIGEFAGPAGMVVLAGAQGYQVGVGRKAQIDAMRAAHIDPKKAAWEEWKNGGMLGGARGEYHYVTAVTSDWAFEHIYGGKLDYSPPEQLLPNSAATSIKNAISQAFPGSVIHVHDGSYEVVVNGTGPHSIRHSLVFDNNTGKLISIGGQ